jgi:ParB family chromosome partitioning protein
MVRSIKEMGILLPIIVRQLSSDNEKSGKNEKYEILSGHNRVNAAKEAGLSEVPAIIKRDLSDDEAKLIVTETNLIQRSFADLTHSERAIALKHHIDAIKEQGKRTDIINEINTLLNGENAGKIEEISTSTLLDKKLLSVEKTGLKYGLSRANIARYIRITYLNKSLQDRVDTEEIGLYAAVSISYITLEEQTELNTILAENNRKVDMKKAELLREYSKANKLTPQTIEDILSGAALKKKSKASSVAFQAIKIKPKVLSKYFKLGDTPEDIEAEFVKALEFYRAHKSSN